MTWTIVKGLFASAVSLALAVFITAKASTTFETAAFLAALIAFHRLQFQITGNAMAGLYGRTRAELWFHRIDYRLGQLGTVPIDLPEVLRDLSIDGGFRRRPDLFTEHDELEAFRNEVDAFEKNAKVRVVVAAITETLLGAALLYVLMA